MLGQEIKKIRKSRNMTQEELAQRLFVVRQTVSKWERGYSVPDAEQLQSIADIFEIEVKELLGGQIKSNDKDEVIEQLSRLNEQMVVRNKHLKKLWKMMIVLCSCLIIAVGILITIIMIKPKKNYVDQPLPYIIEIEDFKIFYDLKENDPSIVNKCICTVSSNVKDSRLTYTLILESTYGYGNEVVALASYDNGKVSASFENIIKNVRYNLYLSVSNLNETKRILVAKNIEYYGDGGSSFERA